LGEDLENLNHQEILEKGAKALKDFQLDSAEAFFSYGLKQNEYSAEAHLGFAKLYLLKGNAETAHFWAQKAKDLAEDKADAVAIIAACHMCANRFGQAISLLQKALVDAPDNALVLANLGKALVMSGKAEEAKPILTKALQASDALEVVHYDLAVAYAENPQDVSELEKAIDHLTAAIEANPSFPPPYFLFSKISVRLDLADQAIALLSDGVGYNPDMLPFWEELHALYVNQQNAEKAMVQALELVSRRGSPLDYMRVGNTALLTQDYKGALLAYKQAHELETNDPAPILNMAHVHRIQEHRSQAVKYYRQAAQLQPQWHKPFLGMGLVSLELDKDPKEAREHLLAASKIAPKDFEVCIYLALCAQELANKDECQQYAQKALEVARSPRESKRAEALLQSESEN